MHISIHPYDYCRIANGLLRGVLDEAQKLLDRPENIPGFLYEKIGGGEKFLTLEEKLKRAEKGLPPEDVKGSYYRAKPTARIFKIVAEAAKELGEVMPAVYVEKDNDLNATCHQQYHTISFTRKMLEKYTDAELKSTAGHELQHFKHDDIAWKASNLIPTKSNFALGWLGLEIYKHGIHISNNQILNDLGASIPTIAATSLIALCTAGLIVARNHYNEYDADKAAVKVAGADASSSDMAKIKASQDKYRNKELSWVEKTKGKVPRMVSEIKQNLHHEKLGSRTHPPTRKRIEAILSGQVPDILHREL